MLKATFFSCVGNLPTLSLALHLWRRCQACVVTWNPYGVYFQTASFTIIYKTPSIISALHFTSTMTDSLIPLVSGAIYWREQLFDLVAPATVTAEKFEETWPLVYSHRQTQKTFKG